MSDTTNNMLALLCMTQSMTLTEIFNMSETLNTKIKALQDAQSANMATTAALVDRVNAQNGVLTALVATKDQDIVKLQAALAALKATPVDTSAQEAQLEEVIASMSKQKDMLDGLDKAEVSAPPANETGSAGATVQIKGNSNTSGDISSSTPASNPPADPEGKVAAPVNGDVPTSTAANGIFAPGSAPIS